MDDFRKECLDPYDDETRQKRILSRRKARHKLRMKLNAAVRKTNIYYDYEDEKKVMDIPDFVDDIPNKEKFKK